MATLSLAVCDRLTKITVLNRLTITCESEGCEGPARFLFRTGVGPISANCDRHAHELASRMSISLPEPVDRALLSSDWQALRRTAKPEIGARTARSGTRL
jgi:hypothetical protein